MRQIRLMRRRPLLRSKRRVRSPQRSSGCSSHTLRRDRINAVRAALAANRYSARRALERIVDAIVRALTDPDQ